MGADHRGYRAALRLYPRSFRDAYGEALVDCFADLCRDQGRAAARRRTALDLLVTVPRYRLETLMTPRHTTSGIWLVVATLALVGIVGLFVGLYLAVPLLALAVVIAVAQRSRLARSLQSGGADARRRRLTTAVAAAVVTVICVGAYAWDLRDNDLSLLLFPIVGTGAMVATAVFLVAGLATRRPAVGP